MVSTSSTIQPLIEALRALDQQIGGEVSQLDEPTLLEKIIEVVKPLIKYLDDPTHGIGDKFRFTRAIRICQNPSRGWDGVYLTRDGRVYRYTSNRGETVVLSFQELVDEWGFVHPILSLVSVIKKKVEKSHETQTAFARVAEEIQALVSPASS